MKREEILEVRGQKYKIVFSGNRVSFFQLSEHGDRAIGAGSFRIDRAGENAMANGNMTHGYALVGKTLVKRALAILHELHPKLKHVSGHGTLFYRQKPISVSFHGKKIRPAPRIKHRRPF